MIQIDTNLTETGLRKKVERLFSTSAQKIRSLESNWDTAKGSPVFTVGGKYTSRGWTEWTQGFQFGSAILQFDATGDEAVPRDRPARTLNVMAPHVTHVGVHDHGFNNVSTYGNLWRLMHEGRIRGQRVGARFLRAGAEMFRRGAGGALDANRGRRRLHLFVQRPALACSSIRSASLRALAVSPPTRPRADGRERPPHLVARPSDRARAARPLNIRCLRRRPRRLRRARPHGARERFQHEQRRLSLPEFAAGLFAVHARGRAAWRGQCSDLRSNWSFSPPCGRGIECRTAARSDIVTMMQGRAEATCDFYHREHADRRHALLGHRRAGSREAGRLAHPSLRIRITTMSRSTARPRRLPRKGCCVLARYLRKRPLQAGRPHGCEHAAR